MNLFMGFVFFMISIQLLSKNLVLPCSPGPRYGYRHQYKRLSPLVRGQYVPDLSETTIGASGPAEKPIRRGTSEFGDLVVNYNPDVIFMDEENDGSDRVMTKRCKDRVDTLAILVIKQWDGVRLRITEAWESSGIHPAGSLHYEGRAVDFTTDDRDTTKYPLLARLAVEAGFDWVHYKSKYFIHASVRSDNSDSAKYGGCFSGDSIVYKSDNTSILLKDVAVGNKVLAVDRISGRLVHSDVIMLMDKQLNVEAQFTEIATANSKITLTKNHMIFVANEDIFNQSKSRLQTNSWIEIARPVFAETVKPGEYIYIDAPTSGREKFFPVPSLVTSVQEVVRRGVVAPLTEHGTVVVDSAVASCYSVFTSEPFAHASFFPARTFKYFRSTANDVVGMHWYTRTLSKIANYIFPKSFFRLV